MFEPYVYRGRLKEWVLCGPLYCVVDLDLGFGISRPETSLHLANLLFRQTGEGFVTAAEALVFSNQFMPSGSNVVVRVVNSGNSLDLALAEIALEGNTVAGTVNEALIRAGHAERPEPEHHDD